MKAINWITGFVSEILLGILWLTILPIVALAAIWFVFLLFVTYIIMYLTPTNANGPIAMLCKTWVTKDAE